MESMECGIWLGDGVERKKVKASDYRSKKADAGSRCVCFVFLFCVFVLCLCFSQWLRSLGKLVLVLVLCQARLYCIVL